MGRMVYMESQATFMEVDVRKLIPETKDVPTEMSVCGCKAGIQAEFIRSLRKK